MSTQVLENSCNAVTDAKKSEKKSPQRIVSPRIDLFETANGYVLLADLPGVKGDQLEVTVEKDVLTLAGKVELQDREGFRRVYSDRPVTNYQGRFKLHKDIDRESIEAELKNGVLRLTLKKVAPAVKTSIAIKTS
ncbi:MAG: Hsp20/alpha crystallin family protein [Planctomycetota bacterium]|nr:Hsp20/alpha crystallin family protein [Planctomycetota bacterium]